MATISAWTRGKSVPEKFETLWAVVAGVHDHWVGRGHRPELLRKDLWAKLHTRLIVDQFEALLRAEEP